MGLMAYSITAVTHCTKVGRLSPMNISRIAVGAVIAILLSDNAIAGALEDCAAAYDRKDQHVCLLLSMAMPARSSA